VQRGHNLPHLDFALNTVTGAYLCDHKIRVTVFSGKIEMGQGVMTSLAQMIAEDWALQLGSIDMVLGDTDRCSGDMGTFVPLTTRVFGPASAAALRQARLLF